MYMVVIGATLMGTTSAMPIGESMEIISATPIGKEAGTFIIRGTLTISMTTGQNIGSMVAIPIIQELIMLTILSTTIFHHLWKEENSLVLLGKRTRDTIFHHLLSLTMAPHPVAFQMRLLLTGPMPVHLCQLSVKVTSLDLKVMSLSLCQGMILIDTLHQEKMVLMHFMRHICGTPTVLSFGILEFDSSCKIYITFCSFVALFLFIISSFSQRIVWFIGNHYWLDGYDLNYL